MAETTGAGRVLAGVRERLNRLWWLALFLAAKYSLELWLATPPSADL